MRRLWFCERNNYITDCYPVAINIHVASTSSAPPALSPCRRMEAVTQQASTTTLHTQEHSSLWKRHKGSGESKNAPGREISNEVRLAYLEQSNG